MEYWVVMAVKHWDGIEAHIPFPAILPASPFGKHGPIGFLPVFERMEDAEKWAEGKAPVSRVYSLEETDEHED